MTVDVFTDDEGLLEMERVYMGLMEMGNEQFAHTGEAGHHS